LVDATCPPLRWAKANRRWLMAPCCSISNVSAKATESRTQLRADGSWVLLRLLCKSRGGG
jgi:hypothetical protein